VACYLLGVNPFDQPDVESAKIAARAMLEKMTGPEAPEIVFDGVGVSSAGFNATGNSLTEVIASLTAQVDTDLGYLSIHAYWTDQAFRKLYPFGMTLPTKLSDR
jgi:hypothetical protein